MREDYLKYLEIFNQILFQVALNGNKDHIIELRNSFLQAGARASVRYAGIANELEEMVANELTPKYRELLILLNSSTNDSEKTAEANKIKTVKRNY